MEAIKSFFQTRRVGIALTVLVLLLGVLAFGVYQALTYSWPMHKGDYETAIKSARADKAIVLYDAALVAYQAKDYEAAKRLLTQAYSACADESGQIPPGNQLLGSQIQFLLGNSYVNLKKVDAAVKAYQESLRLDPTNLYTKYNLELLQSQTGGSGGTGGDPQGPGGSGKGGGKKGI